MRTSDMTRSATLGLILLLCAALAQAGPWGWVGKKLPGSAQAIGKALSKADIYKMAGGLGATAIYVEVSAGRVTFSALDATSDLASGTVDDIAELLKSARRLDATRFKYVVSRESVENLGDRLDALLRNGPVFIADPVAGPLRLVAETADGTRHLFKELRPGIITPLDSQLTEDVLAALNHTARREDIAVVAVFADSDVGSMRRLAAAAGDRLLDPHTDLLRSEALRELRGKTVVVVGHVEGGSFVARRANGSISHTVAIDELERVAQESSVTLISAGCSSFLCGSKAGFAGPVTDIAMADGVRKALASDDVGAMLGAFGHGRPLVVSNETLAKFADTRRLDLLQDARFARSVNGGGMSVRMFKPGHRSLVDEPLFAFWFLGAIASVCMFKTNRAAFLRAFPVLPTPAIPALQMRFAAAWLGRESVFLALSPVFMSAVALSWFFGGWKYRRDFISFLWTAITQPYKFLLKVAGWLVVTIMALLVYGLVIVALLGIVASAFTIAYTYTTWPGPLSLVLWGVFLFCAVGGLWAFIWFNRRVNQWLGDDSAKSA